MAKNLGFIGLGRMGGRMVATLAKAGEQVTVYDANPEVRVRAAAQAGVRPAASPAEVAASAEVLFTCLPNDAIVREVYLGDEGIASGARPGLITCDCSTVSPGVTTELHETLAKRQVHHMDTPMLGSTPQAESGDIFFIVGGPEAHLPAIAPYLEIMGKMHRLVGGPGAGNWIKLAHNVLGAVNAVAVAEALAVCKKAEVDLEHFYQVVKNGGGMAFSTYFDKRVQSVMAGDYDATFTVELMNKDVGLANQLADSVGVPVPIMKETQRTYEEALENGWGEEDFSAVTHVIEKRIGRKISD